MHVCRMNTLHLCLASVSDVILIFAYDLQVALGGYITLCSRLLLKALEMMTSPSVVSIFSEQQFSLQDCNKDNSITIHCLEFVCVGVSGTQIDPGERFEDRINP